MIEKRATSEINTKDSGYRYPKEQNYILEFEYSSDRPHQLTMVTERDPRGIRKNSIDQYTFDSAGNLESKLSHTNGKRRDLKWSAENRLQEVHKHGNIQKYTYNADGERIKKEGNNGESIYVNQFYHVRNSLLSFKHIYAGNTRIATKVVPGGNRPPKNRTGNQGNHQINLVGDPMQLDPAKVNQQLNLDGHSAHNGAGQGNGQNQNNNDKNNNGNNGKKGNSGNNNGNNGNNGNQNQGANHDNSDVVIPPDCAFPIDQVKGNVTQEQVDNWCRRNAGINPNRGNAWGRNNNNGNNNAGNKGNNNQGSSQSQGTGGSTENGPGSQGNGGARGDNNGQGPVNAQGNAYAWGWYANKDEYRTPPGKSRGKGTTGLKEPKIYFYHGDHLGSANYVTDVIGEVFEHTINFPFGEIWIDEGSNTSLLGFKFTGKELDEETGYIYFGARYYDPKVSVWVSTDPAFTGYFPNSDQIYFPKKAFNSTKDLKGIGGVFSSTNLNLYHYVSLNPIHYIDPEGKEPLPAGAQLFFFSYFKKSAVQVDVQIGILARIITKLASADAVTIGNTIFFAPGKYDPNSDRGIALIGHEIQHTFQYQKLGKIEFLKQYKKENDQNIESGMSEYDAYRNISFEKKAWAVGADITKKLKKDPSIMIKIKQGNLLQKNNNNSP